MADYIIVDTGGDNTVEAVVRKIDDKNEVYYEIRGKNKDSQGRILRVYSDKFEPYVENTPGTEIKATGFGVVHTQIKALLKLILRHFQVRSLDFNLDVTVQQDMPKEPTKDFINQAAKRALMLGDAVSTKQIGAHYSRGGVYGSSSDYYNEGDSTRLNLFQALVSGSKEGHFPFASTTAYGLSLLTYLSAEYDKLSARERQLIIHLYECVAGKIPDLNLDPKSSEYRRALADGLKAEVNEITALLECKAYKHDVTEAVHEYTDDLILGNPLGRPVIDKNTSKEEIAMKSSGLNRPANNGFFPEPPESSDTDQIVLQAGGCKTHSAIVCIWKQALDAHGVPVIKGDGKQIASYKVYRTICNAGFGKAATITPNTLYHEFYHPTADKKSYSVCTQEVLLPPGSAYSHDLMRNQIKKLVNAERELLIEHYVPGTSGPNGEIGTTVVALQQAWRTINSSIHLGPVVQEYSTKTNPQTTGNCTARSIKEYSRWELIRQGVTEDEAADILDKHWRFAGQHNSAQTAAALSILPVVVVPTTAPQPVVPTTTQQPAPVANMNLLAQQRINDFFIHPTFQLFPDYRADQATQQETRELITDIEGNKTKCDKPTMMLLSDIASATVPSNTPNPITSAVGYHLLVKCDARIIPAFQCMRGAVRQVASQFNNGEATSRKETMPNAFRYDRTQGPAEQRTAGGAAIARFAHRKDVDCFTVIRSNPNVNQAFNELFDYQFGYLTPKPNKEKEGVIFLKQHINNLALNVERVHIDDAPPEQTAIQVLNSTIALGNYEFPCVRDEAAIEEMTELLQMAQYRAVAKIAILEAQCNPLKRIPVSFTMIGGTSFGNNKQIIAKAVSQAIRDINQSGVTNIDICLSIYEPVEINLYKSLVQQGDEFKEVRDLLNQTPLTEGELKALTTLPTPAMPTKPVVIPTPPVAPIPNMLNEIKKAVKKAQKDYSAWYKYEKKDLRGPSGFFTRIRHGNYGQKRAAEFNQIIDTMITKEAAMASINKLLCDEKTRFHRHSFSSFLLDELKGIVGSEWNKVSYMKGLNKYSQSDVLSRFRP